MSTNQMVAGREMDALIAERVMGWAWRSYWAGDEEVIGLFPPPPHSSFSEHDQYPEYSTDIASAWLVVEKVHVTHRFLIEDGLGDKRWVVMFGHVVECADTAALAICRAALQAVEAGEK